MTRKIVARVLIIATLLSTIMLPINVAFAESTEVDNSEITQELGSELKTTEGEETLAEPEEVIENVENKLAYLYIESKELTSPGTQNIVVSWKGNLQDVSDMSLVYEDSAKTRYEIKESTRTDSAILFTQTFTEGTEGTYKILGVKYIVDDYENYFEFDDVEIGAEFNVVNTLDDEAIAVVDVDSAGNIDKKEASNEIKDAVQSSGAAKKKARTAKGGGFVVVLNPGHGDPNGGDPGACAFGATEREINMEVAKYCKEELEAYGVTVYLTRTDRYAKCYKLKDIAQFAADHNADLLVSIHQNAASTSNAYGAEVYYPNRNYRPDIGNSGKAVADAIQKELVALGISNRGTKYKNTDDNRKNPDGSVADYYGVIRESKWLGVPAIIVEHAFISNYNDYNKFLSSPAKLRALGVADATGIANYFGLKKGTWVKDENGDYKYQLIDGEFATDLWIAQGGHKYYVNDDGIMVTGLQVIHGNKYLFSVNGLMLTGWQRVNGTWYYFQSNGAAKIGWLYLNGSWYYLDESGEMQTGFQEVNGNTYYLAESGVMQTGWIKVEQNSYYLNSSGVMQKSTWVGDYYVDENGVWDKSRVPAKWIKTSGRWRYRHEDGSYTKSDFEKIGGKTYYFDESGYMTTGWQRVDGIWYYFQSNGAMQIGWLNLSGKWYYLDKEGKMLTGLKEIGGKKYYLASGGAMQTGWIRIDNIWYYFQSGGAMQTGWLQLSGKWYYLDKEGKMLTGLQEIEGKKYYLASGGAMQTGWIKISDSWYYFQNVGGAKIGWLNLNGKWYYLDEEGKMLTGTHIIDGTEYFFKGSGEWVKYYAITGTSSITADQLANYYKKRAAYPSFYNNSQSGATTIEEFCKIYCEEAAAENIRVEVAFCQAMKETGWLKFGGDVKISQYNFAGIGAVGGGAQGATFASVREGVRAQIQHLKAYANKAPLINSRVDPRFNLVTRGCAPYVEWLGAGANPQGKGWAPSATYGVEIVKMIREI